MTRRRATEEDMRRSQCPEFLPQVIGVTLVSPGYEELAMEAIKRAKFFAGLDTLALFVHSEPAFFRKLDLCKLVGRRKVVFYDADLWFVAPVDFRSLNPGFWAVQERGAVTPNVFPHMDCAKFSLDACRYVNTGLMCFDLGLRRHREVFNVARKLAVDAIKKPGTDTFDRTEQSWLNIAMQQIDVDQQFLPFSYNYFDWSVEHFGNTRPEHIIGYHAAGVQLIDKLAHLRDNTQPLPCPTLSPS